MAQDGVHYVVGPNVDDGAAAVRPVAEHNGIMYFPYAFPKELFTAPASNSSFVGANRTADIAIQPRRPFHDGSMTSTSSRSFPMAVTRASAPGGTPNTSFPG